MLNLLQLLCSVSANTSLTGILNQQKHFDIVSHNLEYRVFAIADLHGDFNTAHKTLANAGIVDSKNPFEWIANNSILVQTGDVIDRGNDTIILLDWLDKLDKVSQAKGGKVVRLMGNHEYMNVLGDWRYVSEGDIISFPEPSEESRRKYFQKSGKYGEMFRDRYKLTYKHSGIRVHFQHAGLNPYWATEELDILGQEFLDYCFDVANDTKSISSGPWKDFYSSNGPLWNREYSQLPEFELCPLAQQTRCALGVDLLVFGHTPNLQGVVSRCGGTILLIDTGLTSVMGGRPAVLELRKYKDFKPIERIVHYLDSEKVYLN